MNKISNNIFTIKNFLSDDECDTCIKVINSKTNTTPFTNSGVFTNDKFIDEKLTNDIFCKLKNYADMNALKTMNILSVNNLIMTGKYSIGQEFGIHTDTGLYYDKKNGRKTTYTVLIYLNDNYDGGTTKFYDEEFNETHTIIPCKGMALIFDINEWHKGCQVSNGYKYWIGCELIGNINSKLNEF
jgi:LysM repeat protein